MTAESVPVFLHPPKTGGSSITYALAQNKIIPLNGLTIDQLLADIVNLHQTFKQRNLPADANYAISVRSPYTRYVSIFYQFFSAQENRLREEVTTSQFKKYMLNSIFRPAWLTSPCSEWTKGITGKVNIIKFENLVDDVYKVYGIDLNQFPRLNRNGLGSRYTSKISEKETIKSVLEFYDDSVINFVNRVASKDFNNFGYIKFNNYQEMLDYAQS